MRVQSLGWEDPLEEEMTTHSSILAWETPQTEEPCGLQSLGLQSWTRLRMRAQCFRHLFTASSGCQQLCSPKGSLGL